MKSISFILRKKLLLLAVMGMGCETERIIFKGPYHVRFTEPSAIQKESYSQLIRIEVHNVGPALEEDVVITYTISGDARENVDYLISGTRGQITIPGSGYFGFIDLQLINNANNILRSQDIVFTLQSTGGNLQIGQGESAMGKSFTFTILDDCILGGSYTGLYGNPPIPGITITSTDCETYLLSNWNINVFNTDTEMDLVFIDNGDNTLTIPEQEEDNLAEDFATISGTGIVNPSTREIIMTITLVDYEGQPEVTFTLTPE